MNNLLALSFYCKIYKKKPNIRIFFNEKFIDEYDIESCNSNDEKVKPYLKLYQLNLPKWPTDNFIKLEIKNSDSNYNNGFMTKSTLIKFHTFLLIPTNNFENMLSILQHEKLHDPKMFNLLPYTYWTNEKNTTLTNILHLDIGGSGYFKCNLIRDMNMFKPVLPTENKNEYYHKSYGKDITANVSKKDPTLIILKKQ